MKKVEMNLNGSTLSIETGHVARQSAGSVIVTHGETSVLVAVNSAKEMREDIDFFPLQVEYRERHYAGGKIPGGFFKREARPSEHEILTSRLTDRPIRPLFPKSFKYETQVIITAMSSDGQNMSDVLAGVGASAALTISDIPFNGPIATVRVGRVDGDFVVNPTREQMEESDMEIVVSGNDQTIVMVEGEAELISEKEFLDAMKFAHGPIKEMIALQKELASQLDVNKRPVPEDNEDEDLKNKVLELVSDKIDKAIKIADKTQRQEAISELHEEAQVPFVDSHPDSEKNIKSFIDDKLKSAFREQILTDKVRSDGRSTTDIRPISIDTGVFARTHGSALFTRGETQAIVVLTMGTPRDEQIIDSMDDDYKKRFMLHYNFPPYCVGEVGRIGFTSRREVGHGNLAERAIKQILPDYEDFPYTVRIVSEITESNGSSSMASVCGGSLALMNAGAPSKGHVAGIAMGLIKDGDRYAVLSDILGAEDHLGDMDFKVAGTSEGVTSLQMDIKITGITEEIMKTALEQACDGRLHILGEMAKALDTARLDVSNNAPRITTLSVPKDKIRDVIGTGGKVIREICEVTGAKIDIDDDGVIKVAAVSAEAGDAAINWIKGIVAEPEVGMIYDGKVVKVVDFGAFVNFLGAKDGLVHISELAPQRVGKVTDIVNEGDQVKVKVLAVDNRGKVKLSMKVVDQETGEEIKKEKEETSDPK